MWRIFPWRRLYLICLDVHEISCRKAKRDAARSWQCVDKLISITANPSLAPLTALDLQVFAISREAELLFYGFVVKGWTVSAAVTLTAIDPKKC